MIEQGKAAHVVLCVLDNYFDDHLAKRIVDLGELSHKHTALKLILFQSRSLLAGMTSMTRGRAGLAYQVITRSMWEYLIDFEVLRSADNEEAERWLAFSEIQRWNRAQRAHDIRAKHDLPASEPAEALLTDCKAKRGVEELISRFWPEKTIETAGQIRSWDLKQVRQRAEALGKEFATEYIEVYGLLSWATHPGAAGAVNVSRQYLDGMSAYCINTFLVLIERMTIRFLEEVGLPNEAEAVRRKLAERL